MKRKDLLLSDQMDYDWITDMYCIPGMQMMISEKPNCLNEHIVHYGQGASKYISHNVWLAFQTSIKIINKNLPDLTKRIPEINRLKPTVIKPTV